MVRSSSCGQFYNNIGTLVDLLKKSADFKLKCHHYHYHADLLQSVQHVVRHVVLQHSLGDEDRVEVLVIGPDSLVGGHLPRPPGLVVVTDDVNDPAGRVERLVDRLTAGLGGGPAVLRPGGPTTASQAGADCLPLSKTLQLNPSNCRWDLYINCVLCFIQGINFPSPLITSHFI